MNKTDRPKKWHGICTHINSGRSTIYTYCDKQFTDKELKNNCKMDTCKLCCSTGVGNNDKYYSLEDMTGCYEDCNKKRFN